MSAGTKYGPQVSWAIGLAMAFSLACSSGPVEVKAPASVLGHIDLVLDSAAYASVNDNTFLTSVFAHYAQDTVEYGGKPSFDSYLAGQESFIHISLAEGYWKDKLGSGALVFQSVLPDRMDGLREAWQQHYPDSLVTQVFKGEDFDLGEVMVYRSEEEGQGMGAALRTYLTSFSERGLRNWGMDSASIADGVTMREFMSTWDWSIPEKLFLRIARIEVRVSEQELDEMASALLTVGYSRSGDRFEHPGNPAIAYRIVPRSSKPGFARIEIELTRPVGPQQFTLGEMYEVRVEGARMVIISI